MWILEKLGIPVGRFDTARIEFVAAWPGWFIWLCLAACALAMVWTWLTVRQMRRRTARIAVFVLRAAILACAVIILFEPQIQLRRNARIKNRVAVLVDASESMSVKDQPGHLSRAEAVADLLRRHQSYFDRLNDEFDVSYFTCGQALAPADLATLRDSPQADQTVTDLTGCLRSLAERYSGAPPQAVLLFTDGGDNASSAPLPEKLRALDQVLAQLKAPVYAVAPASSKNFCDLAVSNVEYEDFAFVRSTWTAYATIKAIGFRDKPVPVSLMQGQSVIATQTVTPNDDVAEFRVKFSFMPIETGKTALTVSVPVYADEALDANNVYRMLVRVIRDKTRVLHLCGRPSWDERFLRQTLKQDPNVDLVSLFILRTPNKYRFVPPSELSLIPFPENALYMENLREFDVVIFQNFNYRSYGLAPHLPNIRRLVQEYGGGIVMIGGDLSFSEGQYANSPIADVLPVEISPDRDQMDSGSFVPQLTDAGRHHPITILDPDSAANEKIWRALPPLAGCNKVLGLKPGAVALAAHPTLTAGSGPMPVIAVMEAGRGRSLAVTTDSTWSWGLPALGSKGAMRNYFTFWHNALRWLIKDPELNLVKIRTDHDSYEPGQRVQVAVTVLDRAYKPAPHVPVQLKLTGPAPVVPPIKPDAVTSEIGSCETSFTPTAPGVYVLAAVADAKDGHPNAATEILLVQYAGPELRDVTIVREWLSHLARQSSATLIELPAKTLPANVRIANPYIARLLEKEDIPLWDNWLVLGLLVGLMGAEWWIRKRAGLP